MSAEASIEGRQPGKTYSSNEIEDKIKDQISKQKLEAHKNAKPGSPAWKAGKLPLY